jgi:hypothetical protein
VAIVSNSIKQLRQFNNNNNYAVHVSFAKKHFIYHVTVQKEKTW